MNCKGIDSNFLSDSLYKETFELVSDIEIATYRNSMLAFRLNHVYPELHINQELIEFYGVDLYMFEATGSKTLNARKLLYRFYKLCELIFETIKREVNENIQVDLFYIKMLSECVAVSLKFCNHIKPCEFATFYNVVKNAVAKVYDDQFIFNFLIVMCDRDNNKTFSIKFRIPRVYSKWVNDRGYRKDYGGFVCYF